MIKLTDLSQNTPYIVEVSGEFLELGLILDKLSGLTRFETDPAPPSVSISDRTASSVKVSWSNVAKTEIYQLVLTGNGDVVTQELSAETNFFEFDNLEPWTVYTVDVISEQGEKRFPGSATFRTRKSDSFPENLGFEDRSEIF